MDYLLDRQLPFTGSLVNPLKDVTWFVDKTGLWTEARVAQALGVPQQALGRLYPYGPLAHCYEYFAYAGAPYFDRAKVLNICQRWQVAEGWSLAGASDWLGLPESTVLLLVARGLLTPLAGSAEPPHCTFDRQTVIDFFDRVAARAIFSEKHVSGLRPLDDAVRFISYYAADPATLLHAALDGKLSIYRRHPELSALSYVCFVDMELFCQGNALPSPLGWVNAHLFARDNKLVPWAIQKWVNAGLIQPKGGTNDYFEVQRLEELTAAHRSTLTIG